MAHPVEPIHDGGVDDTLGSPVPAAPLPDAVVRSLRNELGHLTVVNGLYISENNRLKSLAEREQSTRPPTTSFRLHAATQTDGEGGLAEEQLEALEERLRMHVDAAATVGQDWMEVCQRNCWLETLLAQEREYCEQLRRDVQAIQHQAQVEVQDARRQLADLQRECDAATAQSGKRNDALHQLNRQLEDQLEKILTPRTVSTGTQATAESVHGGVQVDDHWGASHARAQEVAIQQLQIRSSQSEQIQGRVRQLEDMCEVLDAQRRAEVDEHRRIEDGLRQDLHACLANRTQEDQDWMRQRDADWQQHVTDLQHELQTTREELHAWREAIPAPCEWCSVAQRDLRAAERNLHQQRLLIDHLHARLRDRIETTSPRSSNLSSRLEDAPSPRDVSHDDQSSTINNLREELRRHKRLLNHARGQLQRTSHSDEWTQGGDVDAPSVGPPPVIATPSVVSSPRPSSVSGGGSSVCSASIRSPSGPAPLSPRVGRTTVADLEETLRCAEGILAGGSAP